MDNSIYKTPESEAIAVNENDITELKRFSAWWVFWLGVLTLGIYPIYWIYDRRKSINYVSSKKVSLGLIYTFVWVAILSFAAQIVVEFFPYNAALTYLVIVLNLAYFVLFVMSAFEIRKSLFVITQDRIGPVLTFFFSTIYLQYKINEAIDAARNNA